MKLLLVEDDYLQADWLVRELTLQLADVDVDRIATEAEFRERFEDIAESPPDIAVIDVILEWADPAPSMPQRPEDVREGGRSRAGIRCQRMLSADPRTHKVPIILYTVLSEYRVAPDLDDAPANVLYLAKDQNPGNLIVRLRSLMKAGSSLQSVPCSVFVVHGHDVEAKETVARFVEQLGLTAVILHERPSLGKTVIEKLERYSGVRYAIVLLTPDDVGAARSDSQDLAPRARQNVIFELGFFTAKLGRQNVCALHKERVELPSDYHGVLYIPMDSHGAWRAVVARELRGAGVEIDASRVL